MRIILIIQAIIIVCGAYYIYQLRQGETAPANQPAPSPVEREPEVVSPPVDIEATTTAEETSQVIGGPNDAGMEWPIPDEELELR